MIAKKILTNLNENESLVDVESIPKVEMYAPNQFVIRIPSVGRVFQSYSTIICFVDPSGKVFLDESAWDYSTTTGKYRNKFLSEGIAETRKKISTGEYTLTKLNRGNHY